MSPEFLREMIRAHPFVPFTLNISDGRTFEVPHPDFIMVSRSGRMAHVATERNNGEGLEYIDILAITSASTHDPETANIADLNGGGLDVTPPSTPG